MSKLSANRNISFEFIDHNFTVYEWDMDVLSARDDLSYCFFEKYSSLLDPKIYTKNSALSVKYILKYYDKFPWIPFLIFQNESLGFEDIPCILSQFSSSSMNDLRWVFMNSMKEYKIDFHCKIMKMYFREYVLKEYRKYILTPMNMNLMKYDWNLFS